ncbi:hypothetical protein KPH14_008726 [Odynerus spinipes]|uniref:Uncharacterized protein n=1 Tax=Odynerus spinipes TaxID=1348599 RepID=A0AAD9R881_9HYME|nr:hypothetical protein KPH14_008726 [Odynerus spinipes]
MHEAGNVSAQSAKVQPLKRTMILEGSRVRWIMGTAGQQRAAHGKQLRAVQEELGPPTGHGTPLILCVAASNSDLQLSAVNYDERRRQVSICLLKIGRKRRRLPQRRISNNNINFRTKRSFSAA